MVCNRYGKILQIRRTQFVRVNGVKVCSTMTRGMTRGQSTDTMLRTFSGRCGILTSSVPRQSAKVVAFFAEKKDGKMRREPHFSKLLVLFLFVPNSWWTWHWCQNKGCAGLSVRWLRGYLGHEYTGGTLCPRDPYFAGEGEVWAVWWK